MTSVAVLYAIIYHIEPCYYKIYDILADVFDLNSVLSYIFILNNRDEISTKQLYWSKLLFAECQWFLHFR